MGSCCFLAAVMVFAADPMQPSVVARASGDGLSASLQHPAMLIHPPVIFLGYAAWGIPFAAALAALLSGRLDGAWIRHARGWALAAWAILGLGVLVGADWAYEELGWGGYWSWDPVENGSLMPWLTGTALVHCLMTWQNSGILKKTTLALAIITFALCNFAAFLTRSGVFSSLHAFSQSSIGWMFLAWMAILLLSGGWLMLRRRAALAPERAIAAWSSREGLVVMTSVALGLLTAVTLAGTLIVPLSRLLVGRQIVVGAAFYNDVFTPIGLLLLAGVAATPLLRWGGPPGGLQKKMLLLAAACGTIAAGVAWLCGQQQPLKLAILAAAAAALTAAAESLLFDALRLPPGRTMPRPGQVLRSRRRKYAGLLIHLGFVSLAVGIAGSSLGTCSRDVVLRQGETVRWENFSLRCLGLKQSDLPDKTVVSAELEVSEGDSPVFVGRKLGPSPGSSPCTIAPARCFYKQQRQWAGRAAIYSTWHGDLYAILRSRDDPQRIGLTLVDNPMMRWLWLGGWLAGAGALAVLWPANAPPFLAVFSPWRLGVKIFSAAVIQSPLPHQSLPGAHP